MQVKANEHAQSMSKWPIRSIYIGNTIKCLIYLPIPFPRGQEVDLEGNSTFPILILLMYIDRLGFFSYFYRCLFNCIATWQGSRAGATALSIEIG